MDLKSITAQALAEHAEELDFQFEYGHVFADRKLRNPCDLHAEEYTAFPGEFHRKRIARMGSIRAETPAGMYAAAAQSTRASAATSRKSQATSEIGAASM